MSKEFDIITKPKHYNMFEKFEVIDVIDDVLKGNQNYKGSNAYYLGNVIKYLFRAGLKNDFYEDLKKAQYYLSRIISKGEGDV